MTPCETLATETWERAVSARLVAGAFIVYLLLTH